MMPKLFINVLLLVWGNKGSNHHEEEKHSGLLSMTSVEKVAMVAKSESNVTDSIPGWKM
jgi:hypothetical protein